MAASAVDLGTIYATIALSMDTFGAQVTEAQGQLDGLMASAAAAGAPFDALDEASAAAGEALARVSEASASARDALSTAGDAAAANADALSALDEAASSGDAALASLGASAEASGAALDAASAQVDANSAALDANTAAADANALGHKTAGEASEGLGASMGKLVMPAAIAEAAIVGLGAVAVKLSSDFQASMTQLVTGAGESVSNLQLVSNGILAMASQTGESTTQLAQAMFTIESAGDHGAKGLAILRDAAESSRESGAQLADTANALTTVLANYGSQGVTAANATNVLLGIVSNGKTTMQDLASSISTVLPAAAKYGVSLTDVGAALATMTAQNGDAAASTTYLRQLLTSLASPSAASQKALASIGLSAQQVSDDMKRSLPDTLQLISDRINSTFPPGSVAATTAFKDIAGGSRQMQGMLLLTGQSMGTFKQNVLNVSDAVKQGGNTIAGWSLTQKDLSTQLAQAGAAAQVALIQAGTALEPIVKQVVANLLPALKQFGDWAKTHGPEIARAFEIAAVAIGVVLVAALATATATFLIAQAVAIAIVGALVLLAGAIAIVVTHWQQIIGFITSGNPIMVALEAAVAGVGAAFLAFGISQIPALIAAIPGVLVSLGTMAAGWWADATAATAAAIATLAAAAPFILVGAAVALLVVGIIELIRHWPEVQAFFENLAKSVGGFFSGLGARVHTALSGILTTIGGWFASVGTFLLTWGEKILGWYLWPYVQVWKVLSPILNGIWQAISAVFGFIVAVIRVASDIIIKLVQDAWNWVYGTVIGPILSLIKGIIVTDWAFISSVTQTVWNAISGFFSTTWNAIWTTITTVLTTIKTWLADRWDEIHAKITAVWTTVHDDISSVWDKITSTIQGKADKLRDAVLKPFNDAKGLIGGVVKGFANAAITELNKAIQGWADLGNDLGNVINSVAKAVGVSDRVPTLTLPTIPALAGGTKHHAGGLALVGEEGPELVHLPKGASVLPAKQTAGLLGYAGAYAGGVGDFFSSLGSHVSGALGAVSALIQEGPAAIVAQALGALGLNPASAPGMLGSLGAGVIATLRREVQTYVGALLATVSDTISSAASAGSGLAGGLAGGLGGAVGSVLGGGRSALGALHFANGGVLREAVAGVGMSSGRSYLLGENGPEAVTPLGPRGQAGGGGDTFYLTVEVVAAPSDGAPYPAGVAFGNGFAAGFQQARTQRGL